MKLTKMPIVLIMALLFAQAFPAGGLAASDPIVFQFAYDDAPLPFQANEHALAVVFKSIVENATNKEIQVELFPAGTLGKERERIELVQSGIIQGTIASIGGLSQFMPEIGAIDIPFAFRSYAVAHKVFDGPFGDKLADALYEKMGVRLVGVAEAGGFYALTNSIRPIRTPKDLDGIKVRTMEAPVQMAMMRALGAAPTPIAWSEVYTSLQTGVVDGQHNPVPIIVHGKLYEVQKYVTLTNHLYGTDWWLINDDFLQSLTPEHKRIVMDAVKTAMVAARGINRIIEATDQGVAYLEEQGAEVYAPTTAELEEFRKLAVPAVLEYVESALGDAGLDWANSFLEAIEQAEAELDAEADMLLK